MALLVCSLAYLTGIIIGRLAWQSGLFDCQLPNWIWIAFLSLLAPAILAGRQLDRRRTAPESTLRWPLWAGFDPIPPSGPPVTLLLIIWLLCRVSTLSV